MNMIYNSPNYCVVEFGQFVAGDGSAESAKVATNSGVGKHFGGGFEIMDKTAKREIFLEGKMADNFRKDVAALIGSEPSLEEIDEFLSRFDAMMQQPLSLH